MCLSLGILMSQPIGPSQPGSISQNEKASTPIKQLTDLDQKINDVQKGAFSGVFHSDKGNVKRFKAERLSIAEGLVQDSDPTSLEGRGSLVEISHIMKKEVSRLEGKKETPERRELIQRHRDLQVKAESLTHTSSVEVKDITIANRKGSKGSIQSAFRENPNFECTIPTPKGSLAIKGLGLDENNQLKGQKGLKR